MSDSTPSHEAPSTRAFFAGLGRSIQDAWVRADARESDFPSICVDALTSRSPSDYVALDDLLALGFDAARLPEQVNADWEFGQPPITLFVERRFYISALFWLEATTAIHEHAFSGAFHVLHGRSIHTTFQFEESRSINEYMKIGALRETQVELLERGATRAIRSAGGTIHSLFHLAQPSVTIVVRTRSDAVWRPQYTYWRPGIACGEGYDHDELVCRQKLMTVVHRTAPDRLSTLVRSWLDTTDFVSAFLGLAHAVSLMPPDDGDRLLAETETRHDRLVPLVRDVVENMRRERFIIRRRSATTEPTLRFFLAVLLNVRGRERALRLVADNFPGQDPIDLITGWTRALGDAPPLDSEGESALGFRVDNIVISVLRVLLRGGVPADVAKKSDRNTSLTQIDPALLIELGEALRQSELFGYLLA